MIAINPHLYKEMQTDPLKDLAPVASVVSNQWVLSGQPFGAVKNFSEFVEYARRARPPLAYASAATGSIHQLAMEMLKQRASIDLIHVPYKGGAPAATATVAGEVAAMFSGTSSAPPSPLTTLPPPAPQPTLPHPPVSHATRTTHYPSSLPPTDAASALPPTPPRAPSHPDPAPAPSSPAHPGPA